MRKLDGKSKWTEWEADPAPKLHTVELGKDVTVRPREKKRKK